MDKIDRRWTIIFGSIGCAIAMSCIAGGVKVDTKLGAVAIAFMFLDCHALGVHAVAWLYACEINSLYLPLPLPLPLLPLQFVLPLGIVLHPNHSLALTADAHEIKESHWPQWQIGSPTSSYIKSGDHYHVHPLAFRY